VFQTEQLNNQKEKEYDYMNHPYIFSHAAIHNKLNSSKLNSTARAVPSIQAKLGILFPQRRLLTMQFWLEDGFTDSMSPFLAYQGTISSKGQFCSCADARLRPVI